MRTRSPSTAAPCAANSACASTLADGATDVVEQPQGGLVHAPAVGLGQRHAAAPLQSLLSPAHAAPTSPLAVATASIASSE